MTLYKRLAKAEIMEKRYKNIRINLQAQINKLREEMVMRIDGNGWKVDLISSNRIEIHKQLDYDNYSIQDLIIIYADGKVSIGACEVRGKIYELSKTAILLSYEDIKMIQDAIRLLKETSNV